MEIIGLQKVVGVSYRLSVSEPGSDEPELIETTTDDEPMLFLFGESGLPERFEQELQGKQVGQRFNFTITPDQGYGEYHEDDVAMLPLDVFKVDGKIDPEVLQPGRSLPMSDDEGNVLRGLVLEITDTGVLMDFNHPLAGKTLHFDGKVASIRAATAEEVAHGHVHGPGGHQH
jgi:FKBP-type peptidyl-prolyl cis-trans isomerase SlyD